MSSFHWSTRNFDIMNKTAIWCNDLVYKLSSNNCRLVMNLCEAFVMCEMRNTEPVGPNSTTARHRDPNKQCGRLDVVDQRGYQTVCSVVGSCIRHMRTALLPMHNPSFVNSCSIPPLHLRPWNCSKFVNIGKFSRRCVASTRLKCQHIVYLISVCSQRDARFTVYYYLHSAHARAFPLQLPLRPRAWNLWLYAKNKENLKCSPRPLLSTIPL